MAGLANRRRGNRQTRWVSPPPPAVEEDQWLTSGGKTAAQGSCPTRSFELPNSTAQKCAAQLFCVVLPGLVKAGRSRVFVRGLLTKAVVALVVINDLWINHPPLKFSRSACVSGTSREQNIY